MLNFVFLGCHHDDIELGAGILTQRALAANDSVSWIVLTDDERTLLSCAGRPITPVVRGS